MCTRILEVCVGVPLGGLNLFYHSSASTLTCSLLHMICWPGVDAKSHLHIVSLISANMQPRPGLLWSSPVTWAWTCRYGLRGTQTRVLALAWHCTGGRVQLRIERMGLPFGIVDLIFQAMSTAPTPRPWPQLSTRVYMYVCMYLHIYIYLCVRNSPLGTAPASTHFATELSSSLGDAFPEAPCDYHASHESMEFIRVFKKINNSHHVYPFTGPQGGLAPLNPEVAPRPQGGRRGVLRREADTCIYIYCLVRTHAFGYGA